MEPPEKPPKRFTDTYFRKLDVAKDKKTKYSIRDIPEDAPYPLNVFDRDYLIQSFELYKQRQESRSTRQAQIITKHMNDGKGRAQNQASLVQSHILFQLQRLRAILDSTMIRKMFSAVFYALVAVINGNTQQFVLLTQFVFRKYFSLTARLNQPKDPVLNVLPFVLSKAILLVFSDKFKEKFASLIKCSDANTDKLAKEMAEAEAMSVAADQGSTAGGKTAKDKPKEAKDDGL